MYVGIDLCQHLPSIYAREESSMQQPPPPIPPSVVMPRYRGEKPIFGTFATRHRSGKGWTWPPESRIVLADEGMGCARVPLICAFAKLLEVQRSSEKGMNFLIPDDFAWAPRGDRMATKAADILVGSAHSYAHHYTDHHQVLVIPDGFQELIQEKLNIQRKKGLQYIPRSMALALCWINDYYSHGVEELEEGWIGHLRVCSLELGEWVLDVVPLKVIYREDKKFLVPVFDPQKISKGLGVSGIAYACMHFLATEKREPVREIWREVLNGTYIEEWVQRKPEWNFSKDTLAEEQFQSYMRQLPHFQEVLHKILTEQELETEAKRNWEEQYEKLPQKAENLMGMVIDGTFCRLPIRLDHELGKYLAQLNLPENTPKIALQTDLHVSLASKGAAYFGEKLAEGLPTYQYQLIPIEILCKTERGEEWISLIRAETTLDAGTVSEPYDISGFGVKKGESQLCLKLRRPCIHKQEMTYKSIASDKLSKIYSKNTPVTLRVKIKPGDGFAVVEIKTQDGETLATLNWQKMEECTAQNPPLQYLELNTIVAKEQYWEQVQDIGQQATALWRVKKIPSKDLLKNLLDKLRDKVADKNKPNRSYGPIASHASNMEEVDGLKQLQDTLLEMWKGAKFKNTGKQKNIIFQCIGCLYLYADTSYQSELRSRAEDAKALDRETLSSIGRVLDQVEDIQLFYKCLLKKIENEPKSYLNWILALNRLLMFRENALKLVTIDSNGLYRITDMLCEVLKDQLKNCVCKLLAMTCIRTIGLLLYRRKFDSNFLQKNTREFDNIQEILFSFQKIAPSENQKKKIESTLNLLQMKATETDALLLYQDDESDKN